MASAEPVARPVRRRLPAHLPREVRTYLPKQEACPDCGGELKHLGVLEAAGWKVNEHMAIYYQPFDGLLIEISDPSQFPAAAQILIDAMKQASIPYEAVMDRNLAAGVVDVRIGKRP